MYLRNTIWQSGIQVSGETTVDWANEFTVKTPCVDIRFGLIGYGWKPNVADENIPVLYQGEYRCYYRKNGNGDPWTMFARAVCERAPTDIPYVYQDVIADTGVIDEAVYDIRVEASRAREYEAWGGAIEDIEKGKAFYFDLMIRADQPLRIEIAEDIDASDILDIARDIIYLAITDEVLAFDLLENYNIGHQIQTQEAIVMIVEYKSLFFHTYRQVFDIIHITEYTAFWTTLLHMATPIEDVAVEDVLAGMGLPWLLTRIEDYVGHTEEASCTLQWLMTAAEDVSVTEYVIYESFYIAIIQEYIAASEAVAAQLMAWIIMEDCDGSMWGYNAWFDWHYEIITSQFHFWNHGEHTAWNTQLQKAGTSSIKHVSSFVCEARIKLNLSSIPVAYNSIFNMDFRAQQNFDIGLVYAGYGTTQGMIRLGSNPSYIYIPNCWLMNTWHTYRFHAHCPIGDCDIVYVSVYVDDIYKGTYSLNIHIYGPRDDYMIQQLELEQTGGVTTDIYIDYFYVWTHRLNNELWRTVKQNIAITQEYVLMTPVAIPYGSIQRWENAYIAESVMLGMNPISFQVNDNVGHEEVAATGDFFSTWNEYVGANEWASAIVYYPLIVEDCSSTSGWTISSGTVTSDGSKFIFAGSGGTFDTLLKDTSGGNYPLLAPASIIEVRVWLPSAYSGYQHSFEIRRQYLIPDYVYFGQPQRVEYIASITFSYGDSKTLYVGVSGTHVSFADVCDQWSTWRFELAGGSSAAFIYIYKNGVHVGYGHALGGQNLSNQITLTWRGLVGNWLYIDYIKEYGLGDPYSTNYMWVLQSVSVTENVTMVKV